MNTTKIINWLAVSLLAFSGLGANFAVPARINPTCWAVKETNYKRVNILLKDITPPVNLTILPGAHHSWGCCPCKMCLGNHLINSHNLEGYYINCDLSTTGYLNQIGSNQWPILHDNLHNDPNFSDHIPTTKSPVSVFAPTPVDVVNASLELANVTANDIVFDLGSGDGRVLITASKVYKCRSVGIDIDPIWVAAAKENITLNKLDNLCRVYHDDILTCNFQKYATVVFIYLLPDLSEQLVPKLKALPKGSRVIFHDKPAPGLHYKIWNVKSRHDGQPHKIYIWTATSPP